MKIRTEDWRQQVVDEVQGGRPVAAVARAYGISRTTLYSWLRSGDRNSWGTRGPVKFRKRWKVSASVLSQTLTNAVYSSQPRGDILPVLWSWRDVAAVLKCYHGAEYHRTRILALLRGINIPPAPWSVGSHNGRKRRGQAPSGSVVAASQVWRRGGQVLYLQHWQESDGSTHWVFRTPRGRMAVGKGKPAEWREAVWHHLYHIAEYLRIPVHLVLCGEIPISETDLQQRLAACKLSIAVYLPVSPNAAPIVSGGWNRKGRSRRTDTSSNNQTSQAERLAKALMIELASGVFPPGGRFWSNRRIQLEWRVGRKTADAAINILHGYSLLYSKPRSGYYVGDRPADRGRLLLSEMTWPPLEHRPRWVSRRQQMRLPIVCGDRLPLLIIGDLWGPNPTVRTTRQWLDLVEQGEVNSTGVLGLHVALFRKAIELGFSPEYLCCDNPVRSYAEVEQSISGAPPAGVVAIRNSDMNFKRIFSLLSKKGIPSIAVLNGREQGADVAIDYNFIAAGRRMMHELLAAGYRRIFILSPSEPVARFVKVEDGALCAAQDSPFRDEIKITRLLISFPFSKSTVISLREIFVESQVYPTAILATGIHLYAQTYPLLAGLGIRIPEQVAVVGRGHPSGRIFQKIPPVNLVENDMDAIGSTSATIIRRLIDGHEIPNMTLLEMPYLDRGSIPQAAVTNP